MPSVRQISSAGPLIEYPLSQIYDTIAPLVETFIAALLGVGGIVHPKMHMNIFALINQLLQLYKARTVWSDAIIGSARFGPFR